MLTKVKYKNNELEKKFVWRYMHGILHVTVPVEGNLKFVIALH